MAIFGVIDTSTTGDTFYEGMVKDAANWAIMETEVTDAREGYASIDLRLEADAQHTHGTGGTVFSIVAAEANLGTGVTDGEMKICSVSGNRYMWEAGSAKWQPISGNQYTTANLPAGASYNILTGTKAYDTTLNVWKRYNGSAWVYEYIERVILSKTGDYAVTAADMKGNTIINNTGAAGAVNLTLLAGVAGNKLTAWVTAAQYLRMTANGTETFRYANTQSAAGGYVRDNVIGTIWTIEWSGTEWLITNLVGTLKYDE